MADQLFCSLRKIWISARPEEQIRQYWIQRMSQELGYPLEHMTLEKSLVHMPHLRLSPIKLPARRADLVVFAKGIHSYHELYPFLLVECKAGKLTSKALRQALGYNFYLKASFVAVVNQTAAQLAWYDPKQRVISMAPVLPSYTDLQAKWMSLNKIN